MRSERKLLLLAAALIAMITLSAAGAPPPSGGPNAARLVMGLEGASGSTLGPDGALYVTEGVAGRISRVDPQTGEITTFASGLPTRIGGFGGAVDVAFIGKTAYALITLVGSDVGGSAVVGIYRVDGPDRFTVVADIDEFSSDHPPTMPFGVPTGLAVSGHMVYMAEAGPVPHRPEDGKVVALGPKSPTATEMASGASLLVTVEFGRGRTLYALSQGDFLAGNPEGSPAQPNTGALVKVNGAGTFTVIMDGLDRPTSLEFIGTTAYVVSLTGEIWKIDGVSGPPHGVSR
jgi:hypothetical protein